MSMSKKESLCIDAMRFMAILSVAAAHTTAGDSVSAEVMRVFATGGVAVFFFLSGYLSGKSGVPFLSFIKSKKALVIPWWITGTLVYFYTALRHGGIRFWGFIEWIFGSGTYLWYMSVLLLLQLLFWLADKNKWVFYVIPLLSVANYIAFPYISDFLFENNLAYINVFNWIWIFWLGALLRKKSSLQNLLDVCRKYKFLLWILYVAAVSYLVVSKTPLAYWSRLYPLYVAVFLLASLAFASITYKGAWIAYVGKVSFSIYLLHMPVAGILAFVIQVLSGYSALAENVAAIAAPFICLLIVTVCIWIYAYLVNKTKWRKALYLLVGLPKRMFAYE